MSVTLKKAEEARWDLVSLGEVMLRLDPGENRIKNTRTFKVWEGGGEYNVARGLSKCFRLRSAVVTGIPRNDVGLLLEDLIQQGGVDTSLIKWFDFDGVGRTARVGLNFTERGFGVRGALGVSDRAHSAASFLKEGDIDWDTLFGKQGVRWFHTGGIFAGLSPTTPDVIIEALKAAKRHGAVTSYDLNYRPSLWKSAGGEDRCQQVNKRIAPYVDVMLGNEEDFCKALGFPLAGVDAKYASLDPSAFMKMIEKVSAVYPNLKVVATTLRTVHSANDNDWAAVLWYDGTFYSSLRFEHLAIFDRVGGGDCFASGLIYGFLTGKTPQQTINYGICHGALAMTTPGDTSMASLSEVEHLMQGGSARVVR